ncbi:heat shock protein Hsp90 [Chthoniobacter flavus Ellin428]|uniref:Chaperone protein HtpG n=1 Tax=Chthoniobacter flavus Ellin428 TaxID=497964 RepID=B4CV89_9BACT|nr:molecular chaperone HtpG [Chthoniobacter flavus]EDY21902.1 heat shock protein Hsp90 [Chthoniobacter flavus Ellin428]TCO89295.1 molecular chaperone HtpG [Chthoniobacter flavus]
MSTTEKHAFQAEIAQLLDLVIHSLYTDKEIFVRELISNAADASEKLKFLQTSGTEVFEPELPLKISVSTDGQAKTITFTDTGIGMTHGELIDNLGTIAHSGSKAFLEQLKANKDDANLIGQFGVGFYSAFMVAEKVTVYTRSYQPGESGWVWSSDGRTGYEIDAASDLSRGTKIVVQLKDTEFAQASNIERIIKHYSNFVPFPIELNGNAVNTVQALWTKNKSEITDEEYNDFYKYVAHESEPPLYRLHFSADAPLSIRALLFVPEKSYELLTLARGENEVNLYCRKVLIQPKAKNLFPEWLRFLKGVVDSEDLPLNISRETMQDSALLRKINDVLTKRVLKWLDEEAKADPEKFDKFFREHGHCLKEGVANDYQHRETLAKLLRNESSHTDVGKTTSLTDYVGRMPEEQKEIYYLTAPNREAALASPYYEVFREKKFEVLFLYAPQDEIVMEQLREFDKKRLVAAEKADLKLDKESSGALSEEDARVLANFIKERLGDRVNEVHSSKRLVGSPAVVVDSDTHMTSSMRRMMKMMSREGEAPLESKPNLEINPDHAMLVRLNAIRQSDPALAGEVAEQIFDNALVAAGLLEDPRAMLGRLNGLLEKLLNK